MDKKLLIIAYHFPPDASVGAIRPAKFAKYLQRFGWEVTVLTIRTEHIPVTDMGRLGDVRGIPIERTPVWPSVSQLTLRVRDALRRAPRPAGGGAAAARRDVVVGGASPAPGRPAAARKLLARYFDALFEIPDKQIGWLIPAVRRAYRLIRRQRIPAILASSPPRTAALVGAAASRLTGARLFTDLRDPFFRPAGGHDLSLTPLARRIIGGMETRVMRRSSRVLTTTEKYRAFLQAHYARLPAERFCNIWNGFDAEDFAGLPPAPRDSKFRIAYFGTFYLGRNPAMLLRALNELLGEGGLKRSDLDVRFIGDVAVAEGTPVDELIRREGLTDCVSLEGFIPYREALKAMRQSDVLLLYAPDQYYCIPAKAYDYLGARGRILCIAKEGATADLVRETGTGEVVAPDDLPGLKAALRKMYLDFRRSGRTAPPEGFSRFERERLALELEGLLSHALGCEPFDPRRAVSGGAS